jgi:hypothetical protein
MRDDELPQASSAMLLNDGGALANTVGRIIGVGKGRGIGLLLIVSGLLLMALAAFTWNVKSIKALERNGSIGNIFIQW